MPERQMRVRLGMFVAAAIAALTGLVVVFGGAPNLFSVRNKYSVFFPETPGLSVGTPVRKSGVRIGQVTAIELDETTNRVRVRIEVEGDKLPRTSEKAYISRGLLSGDTTLDFIPQESSPGNPLPHGDPFPSGAEIDGVPPPNTQRLLTQAQQTVPNANEALTKFSNTMSRFEQVGPKAEKSLDEITAFVKSAREVVPELRQTNKQVQDLIGTQVKADPADPDPPANLKTLTKEVQEFVKSMKPLIDNLNTLVKDNQGEVTKVLAGLRLLLQNFNEVFTDENKKAIADTLKNLQTGSKDLLSEENRKLVADILKNVDGASKNINAASGDLKEAIKSARGLMEKAEVTLKEIDAAVKSGGEVFKGANTSVREINARLAQVKTILDSAEKAIKPIADHAEPVMKSVTHAADELATTVAEARGILKLLEQPDGTFGKVLNDPALYNQLVESAAALTRTLTRAEKIAKDLEVFADKVARKPETIGIGGALRPSTGLKESPFAPVAPSTPFPNPTPALPGTNTRPISPSGSGGIEVIPPSSSYKLDPNPPAAVIQPDPRLQPIRPVRNPVPDDR